jgi:hypothetical protein
MSSRGGGLERALILDAALALASRLMDTKQQAASCKRQAASLTRKNYRIIKEVESRNYESKRSN